MNQVATIDQSSATALAPVRRQEVRVVSDPIAVLDTARFEHMQRIATVMARSNLIPHSLCFEKDDEGKLVPLPIDVVTANCFLVVNQAVRWNMDPFAVAQCVSVVHGKLCYEGKLIAAVLEGKLGVELEYEITGLGDAMRVVVSGAVNGKPVLDSKGRPKEIDGTVGEWKTTGRGSPWDAKGGHKRMLRYRGAREWGRVYAPGLMLGVYSDDEMEDLNASHRAQQARLVNEEPPAPPAARITHEASAPVTQDEIDRAEELANAQSAAQTVEEVAEAGRHDTTEVEWTEPASATPEAAATDQPPAPPPQSDQKPAKVVSDSRGGETVTVEGVHYQKVVDVDDGFPGDKPMKSEQHPLDIPPYLRRTAEPKEGEPFNVEDWLKGLGDALSGCEDTEQLAAVQNKHQTPMKGRASKSDWARSQQLVMDAFQRISEAE
ncbi:hypothetical protein I6F35_33450 [Bradyrhizobium sp. BRP22]|uniref:hypothetical protein n=1 Tax=Bradyrhizobium sp. BRP22 TaxID=2793821 RepID=UPI001CD683E9|nr:hypothetical protein [Bradyrhizobium sp. BRP22]MCA1458041.1 hypothetical protein [Bradyrhizobium sp. BRP22]